jgi:hypothetical protein
VRRRERSSFGAVIPLPLPSLAPPTPRTTRRSCRRSSQRPPGASDGSAFYAPGRPRESLITNDEVAACLKLRPERFVFPVGEAQYTGPLGPSEPGRPIPNPDHVALKFPEFVIVGGHIGYP